MCLLSLFKLSLFQLCQKGKETQSSFYQKVERRSKGVQEARSGSKVKEDLNKPHEVKRLSDLLMLEMTVRHATTFRKMEKFYGVLFVQT